MSREPAVLTPSELACCHMAHVEWLAADPAIVKDWRQEFADLPRKEKCRDCPNARKA